MDVEMTIDISVSPPASFSPPCTPLPQILLTTSPLPVVYILDLTLPTSTSSRLSLHSHKPLRSCKCLCALHTYDFAGRKLDIALSQRSRMQCLFFTGDPVRHGSACFGIFNVGQLSYCSYDRHLLTKKTLSYLSRGKDIVHTMPGYIG